MALRVVDGPAPRPLPETGDPLGLLANLVTAAILAPIGEELFFRGFLTPYLGGIVVQAALFGLAHQVSGPSRWVWVAWASLVGLCFGAIFALTGSLEDDDAAHADDDERDEPRHRELHHGVGRAHETP